MLLQWLDRAAALFIVALLVTPGPALASDHTGACEDFTIKNRHSGIHKAVPAQQIKATIEGDDLNICNINDGIAGSFAFVNIQGPSGAVSDIVQLGRGRCKD